MFARLTYSGKIKRHRFDVRAGKLTVVIDHRPDDVRDGIDAEVTQLKISRRIVGVLDEVRCAAVVTSYGVE